MNMNWSASRDGVPEGHEQYTIYDGDGVRLATVFDARALTLFLAVPLLLEGCKGGLDAIEELTTEWGSLKDVRMAEENAESYARKIREAIEAAGSDPALLEALEALCESVPPSRNAGSAELQRYAALWDNARKVVNEARGKP